MIRKNSSQATPVRKRRLGVVGVVVLIAAVIAVLSVSSFVIICGCGPSYNAAAQDGNSRPRRVEGDNNSVVHVNKENATGMSNKDKNAPPPSFYQALDTALELRGTTQSAVCDTTDAVSRRVLEDYGAMFLATESVQPPPVCVFKNESDVASFQNKAGFESASIGGSTIELQPAAMKALLTARKEAQKEGLDITPRGGTEAARRSYGDTRRLWDTRFLPALVHWQKKGRLTREQASNLRAMPLDKQVGEVLELEKRGIFFSKDLSKSILYSIAAPGTSQHIAMLALDVTQFADARVRRILARHGWFQTVKSDLPHFTYLGVTEESLPSLGLRAVRSGEQKFWIPNVETGDR
jgi:hypothetical protein